MRLKPLTRRQQLWLIPTVIGAVAVTVASILVHGGLSKAAVFYVGVPVLVALLAAALQGKGTIMSSTMKALTIALLLSIPVVQEGAVCVLMAAPLLYAAAALAACCVQAIVNHVANARSEREARRTTLRASATLAVLMLASLEGSAYGPLADTRNVVLRETVVDAPVEQVRLALAGLPSAEAQRPLFLRVFPAPTASRGGGIAVGDVRVLEFVYVKWIVANEHRGDAEFEVVESTPDRVVFRLVRDNSYLKGYLGWEEILVTTMALADGRTRVGIAVRYDRRLAPSWYFGPLEAFGVGLAAEVLLADLQDQAMAMAQ